MKLLGQILLACLIIAALQGILAVLACGLLFRTGQTLGLLLFLAFLKGLEVHPWATIACCIALPGLVFIASRMRGSPPAPPLLLPDLRDKGER